MMDSEKHQDGIKQMAKRLREHALPYKEGAWERFEAYEAKKSKRFVLWPYLSGAAAVLIMAVVFLLNKDQYSPTPSQVAEVSRPVPNKIPEKEPSAKITVPKPIMIEPRQEEVRHTRMKKDIPVDRPLGTAVAKQTTKEVEVLASEEKNETRIVSIPMEDEAVKEEKAGVAPTFTAPLQKESFTQTMNKAQHREDAMGSRTIARKKWKVGLEIASTMSNNQVNIGGGVALAYSISPKLSISSGVSYVQLDAQRSPTVGGPSAAMNFPAPSSDALINSGVMNLGRPSEQKTLQSINSHLTGLDIPINLSYHLSQKMYVTAGVSIFNVLEENRINEFKSEFAEVAYADGSNKTPEPKIRTLYSEEAAPEEPYERNNFAGFLNFSVGYRIPFSKSVGFSIAPFFKLPVGTLTEQDMDLTNGGIKVMASF